MPCLRMPPLVLVILILWAAGPASARAGEAPEPPAVAGYRGNWTGLFPDARPVTAWDLQTGRNVLWKITLPDYGHSCPVLVAGKVLFNAEPHTLICADAATGRVLWQQESDVFDLFPPETGPALKADWRAKRDLEKKLAVQRAQLTSLKNLQTREPAEKRGAEIEALQAQSAADQKEFERLWKVLNQGQPGFRNPMWGELLGFTTATPVTDGKCVWVQYGTGVAACYALDGTRQWMVRTGFDAQSTNAGSPLLVNGILILHRAKSYANSGVRGGTYIVCALEAHTGKTLWETPRLATPDWGSGSPLHVRLETLDCIVTISGEVLRAADGKVLAKALFGMRPATSAGPVADGNVVYHNLECDRQPGTSARAARLSLEHTGSVKVEHLWCTRLTAETEVCDMQAQTAPVSGVPDEKTKSQHSGVFGPPLYRAGRLYVLEEQRAFLWVLDAASGKVLESGCPIPPERRDAKTIIWGPLAVAGNYLYMFEQRGARGLVFEVQPALRFVSASALEPTESAPVFGGDRLYVRAARTLYCLGPHEP